METNKNNVYVKLTHDHVGKNGHVSEAGYLTVANVAYWQICENVGLLKLYDKYKISGMFLIPTWSSKKRSLKVNRL